MVERQSQHERLFFKRMGIRREDFSRSSDEDLAFESPRNSYHSSRSAGSRNRSSGIFSLFKWFRKDKSEDSDLELPPSGPGSPGLPRATSITGSVDTLFSTATANSFAYVHPLQYRPFGSANPPEIRIQVGPETNTYRGRIRDRDRLRRLEKNISLREKYRLYGSGTLPRSVDHIHELSDERFGDLHAFLGSHRLGESSTLSRKKKKAPQPPAQSSLEADTEEEISANKEADKRIKQHRRTFSEPAKVCHVKGKRKAPPPPGNSVDSDVVSISTSNSNSSRRGRKKRRAPSPPRNCSKENGILDIIRGATNGILNEELTASGNDSLKEETASNASTLDIGSADVVCTDTLKLERGILKSTMERTYAEPKVCPSSPVSPRPWYKRAANKDGGSTREKEKKKERDRRKVEDWMIESGFPRRSLLNYDNKYNIFSRTDKNDDKRKSQISILTNISELDREAAEIMRRGKEREKNLIDTHNAMYYTDNNLTEGGEAKIDIPDNSRKNSARDLISLFNSITNVTRTTLNPSVYPHDDSKISGKENKAAASDHKYEHNFRDSNNKHPFEIESFDEVVHRKFKEKPDSSIIDDEKPGTSSASSVNSGGKIARVTIEELDDFDAERNSKSQVLYEANKQNRHLSPPIPTIKEVPEGSAKSSPATTPVDKTGEIVPKNTPETKLIEVVNKTTPETKLVEVKNKTTPESKLIEVKNMNVWVCPRCTLENLRWRITCEACDMWRPNPFELREKSNNFITPTKVGKNEVQESLFKKKPKDSAKDSIHYPNLLSFKMDSDTTPQHSPINKDLLKEERINERDQIKPEILANTSKNIPPKNLDYGKKLDNEINVSFKTEIISEKEQKEVNTMNISVSKNISESPSEKKLLESNASHVDMSLTNALENNKKKLSEKSVVKVAKTSQSSQETNQFKEVGTKHSTLSETSDDMNDEIRKARLAFFTKPSNLTNQIEKKNPDTKDEKLNNLKFSDEKKSANGEKEKKTDTKLPKSAQNSALKLDNQNNSAEIQTSSEPKKTEIKNYSDDIEKKKLKEMLIEMKHSLPKRPKPVKKEVNGKPEEQSNKKVIHLSQTTPASNALPSTSKSQPTKSNDYTEAYLIESETVVEEIKIKKPSEKVSSSVQTSGLVTQISPQVKPNSGKEILIPIRVEENTIKDGILYTSVSRGVRKIGTGTFELMRPRDFANIKEIKTESKNMSTPLYVNVVDDDSNSSVKSEGSVNSSEFIDKLSKQLVKPQGVANFRAHLDVSNDKNMNTIAVNRLLKRLETAIASGNHELAAALARELAQLKVNCSVIRQKPESTSDEILLELYVEDKVSHQGPFHIKVKPTITVKELKEYVEQEYEIPIGVQRWILANQLAGNDSATLESHGVNTDGFPIFLYLVIPDLNPVKIEEVIEIDVKPTTSAIESTTAQLVKPSTSGVKPTTSEITTPLTLDNVPTVPQVTKPLVANSSTTVEHVLPDMKSELKEEKPQAGPSSVMKDLEKPLIVETKATGTLALGWKCETCTLMNSPTRPGCAACSSGRPDVYKVPQEYKPNIVEATRIEKELKNEQQTAKSVEEEKAQNYQKLVDLEKDDLIIYPEEFECPVCLVEYEKMEGIVLRECLHVFCRNCLASTIQFSDEAEVKCPYRDDNYTCDSTLLEREIKALVTPKAYEEHLAKSIALAETKIGNAFHCKTPDCVGWCIYEDNVNIFKCPVCTHTNCLTCQAVHEGLNCKQYQEQLNNNSDMNIEVKRTKEMLQEMVDRGEAMNCPTCQVVLMKKWGCDWLRCSMCKTEICWITRGPRWGPNGKGDTSGGCQCGVNGIKCHPKCTYCH